MDTGRLKRKYGYSISEDDYYRHLKLISTSSKDDTFQIRVHKNDWKNFEFVLRLRSNYIVSDKEVKDDFIVASCFKLNEDTRFKVIKSISVKSHPHLNQTIARGTILKYSEEPTYGVVNRYKGIPLKVGESFFQINYEYIKLIDSGVDH